MKFLQYAIIGLVILSISQVQAQETDAPNKEADEKPEKPRNVIIKWDPENREKTELIPLKSTPYESIENLCRPMLSETGTMGYMPERRSIIIHDYQKNIAKIRELINAVDRPAVNIRVEIDFMNTGSSAQDQLDIRMRNRNNPAVRNNLVFQNGKWIRPDDVRIGAGINRGRTTRNTSQFIMTMSGHPATLWVGRTIPDPSWLNNVRFRPSTIIMVPGAGSVIIPGNDPEWIWRDVGSRLMVLPRYLEDDLIEVEIYPEVTYLDGEGRNQAVRAETVSSRLTVRDGQRISIGGVVNDNREFFTNLFGPRFLSRDDSTNVLDMYLTCRIIRPRDPFREEPESVPQRENPHQWR